MQEEFDISESIELNGTGETIRVRLILQSQTVSWFNSNNAGDDMTIDISVNGETMNFSHTSVLPGKPPA